MKKLIIMAALALLATQPALADGRWGRHGGGHHGHGGGGAAVAGAIIGATIIGGIIAATQGQEDESDEYGPDEAPPTLVCWAQDRRGQYYRAFGYSQHRAQRRAMYKCESVSRRCRPMGCQWN